MNRQSKNAQRTAERLAEHSRVRRVRVPPTPHDRDTNEANAAAPCYGTTMRPPSPL
jgi:cystathionine beta-lyase/cystathionine gamma-synthase